jgi:hypothetical protein
MGINRDRRMNEPKHEPENIPESEAKNRPESERKEKKRRFMTVYSF